jgi:F0F1-type ATP synthase epsilon subunit
LGILADHAPLAARLFKRKITLRLASGGVNLVDSSINGFLEVVKNQATILL